MKIVHLKSEVKTQSLTKEAANILTLLLDEIERRGIEEVNQ